MNKPLTLLLIGTSVLAACESEPPPARSVSEFIDNPILLEAAMVRCSRDTYEYRYGAECRNARSAVRQIQAKEEEARRKELEARSESKRQALRRTQAAQAEARRRAEEAERLRREAEYLAQFGALPADGGDPNDRLPEGNVPLAVVPKANDGSTTPASSGGSPTTVPGSNAPVAKIEPADEEPAADLQDIREELRRRNGDGN